jgi:dTDP-4-amino-4,6-dideoxygalactose transaminase
MASNKIPVYKPVLPSADQLLPYLKRIDASRIYTNHGPLHEEFLKQLGRQFACTSGSLVCASSGTAAIAGAILATTGRASANRPYAVIPALTFTATGLAAEMCGFRPWIMDVCGANWSLEPSKLKEMPELNSVGLVIPVAPFGRPVDPRGWEQFQEETGIPVVIDAAACFESISGNPEKYVSDLPTVMSFHATKSFSTAEGGCVVSSNHDLISQITNSLNFGFVGNNETEMPGINGKMSEYNAAIGLAELDSWQKKKSSLEQVSHMYREACEARGIAQKLVATPQICSSYVLFAANNPEEAEAVESNLNAADIGFRHWYGAGLHLQKYFCHTSPRACPVADQLAATLLGLPVAPDLDIESVTLICDQLIRV